MSFLDEIIQSSQIKEIGAKFKIIILDNFLFAIEGYKRMVSISETSIVIAVAKHQRVELIGSNFNVKQLSRGEVVISGKIGGITFD